MADAGPIVTRKLVILVPTYRAAGGVVKLMDYAMHARTLGIEVEIRCPEEFDADVPLFRTGNIGSLLDDDGVRFEHGFQYGLGPKDFALFSWPKHFRIAATRISPSQHPLQNIAIVQGTRWGNPDWLEGYANRVLGMPLARILVTPQVAEVVEPFLSRSTPTRTIMEGHNWPYFFKERSGPLPARPNVGYATWKSDVGIEIEQHFEGTEEFSFRSLRKVADWSELRELYHWSDIFLACPGPEEGFYLPGLEAMAAGAILVTPDVGGNRAHSNFGVNCMLVGHDNAEDYIEVLQALRDGSVDAAALRDAGYRQLQEHTLERERDEFGDYLNELDQLIDKH